MTSRKTTNIDKHVADRLRAARREIGLSQERAAEILDITFQQIQKYEKCTNRLSAGSLYKLAVAYRKSISWFFEGLSEDLVCHEEDISIQLLGALHGADLARDYLAIPSAEQRKALVDLAASMAVR